MSVRPFLDGDRPWRRLGVGICVILIVMFAAGEFVFDKATAVRKPIAFTVYWLLMMGLVGWLCYLAIRDVAYTRRMIAKWKSERDRQVGRPRIENRE